MLERLLSSSLAPGSNRRRDVTATSVVGLLPELGPGMVEVHGDLPEDLAAALDAVGLEVAPVAPVQLWVGGAPGDAPVLQRGGAAAGVAGGTSRSMALAFSPRAVADRSMAARAARVVSRARRRVGGAPAPADAGERGGGSGLYGLGPAGAAAGPSAVATIVVRAGSATDLPGWLRRRLASAGVPLDGRTWRLLADAEYPSQKLAWFLSAPGADAPETVVKLARDRAFSPRLHNEHAALQLLADAGVRGPGVPVPILDDEVHGLALVAEGGVGGRPFSAVGRPEPGDPVLDAAFEAVLAVTARPGSLRSMADGDELRRDLGTLAARLPGADVAAHVAVLANGAPLPTVLQHGDPGTWNLLVGDDGTVAVLDWENAEPRGLPVADALFFAAGVARRSLEARGRRPTPEATVAQLLAAGRWADWTRHTLARAAEAAGCDPARIPALAVLGSAYQAVKELPRLDPAAPGAGEWTRFTAALAPDADRLQP